MNIQQTFKMSACGENIWREISSTIYGDLEQIYSLLLLENDEVRFS